MPVHGGRRVIHFRNNLHTHVHFILFELFILLNLEWKSWTKSECWKASRWACWRRCDENRIHYTLDGAVTLWILVTIPAFKCCSMVFMSLFLFPLEPCSLHIKLTLGYNFSFLRVYSPVPGVPYFIVVHVDGVRLCLWTAATNGPVIHLSDDIWVWRATVEWYWQGKPKNSERNLSQCHFVHHKFHMDWARREAGSSAWRGRRLTAWNGLISQLA
jgi:hypothetical protein